jgi:antitoxin ParD1/3/4
MPTRNVHLTEHFDGFVKTGIASGRFSSASEGLRLLEQREREDRAKIEWLRAAAKEGFDDIALGHYVEMRSGKESDEVIDQLSEEACAEFVAGQKRCLKAGPVAVKSVSLLQRSAISAPIQNGPDRLSDRKP